MDTSKIKDYKELAPYLKDIMDELDKKNRGFIFTVCPKDDKKNTHPLTCIRLSGNDNAEVMAEFWSGLLCIVDALCKQLPEDLRPMAKDSFIAFVKAVAHMNFPSLHFEQII